MACFSPRATKNDFDQSLPHDDDDLELFHQAEFAYTVVKELGVGLQGRVQLVLDNRTQRYVAMKLPTFDQRDGSRDLDLRHLDCQVQSIVQERDAMRLVNHRNVLRLLRSMPGRKSHHAYVMLIMEYASNGDLFDLIAQTGSLPETTCQ